MCRIILIITITLFFSGCQSNFLLTNNANKTDSFINAQKLSSIQYNLLQEITDEDIEFHEKTLQDALEYNQNEVTSGWQNDNSKNFGDITPMDFYVNDAKQDCRHFKQKIATSKGALELNSTACRKDEKQWELP